MRCHPSHLIFPEQQVRDIKRNTNMDPERILIFELNWMGDILFSTPLIRALRERFPQAYISCAVVPRYADLLKHSPRVNDVIALSDSGSIVSIGEKLAFTGMIRKERYDTCFFLKPSLTKTSMAVWAGIRERIGFTGKEVSLTRAVEMPGGRVHRADQLLSLAGALGITEADGTYEHFVNEEDEARAALLLEKAGGGVYRTVALNPGGNWDAKRWPAENYVELARQLLDKYPHIEIMITGAKKDKKLADSMLKAIDSKRCYSVAGLTGLNELAAMFKASELVISADSGPLHLASASGVTTIGLYGPTSRDVTGPRGKGRNIVITGHHDCEVPCYVEECDKDYICMKSIKADEVFKAAAGVL